MALPQPTSALGIDIAGVEDVDLFLSSTDPSTSAAQAAARTILHNPGKLWWAPDAGHDVRQYVHGTGDLKRIQHNVQAAIERDERVKSAEIDVTTLGREIKLGVSLVFIDGTTANLTLAIDELGEVLDAQVLG